MTKRPFMQCQQRIHNAQKTTITEFSDFITTQRFLESCVHFHRFDDATLLQSAISLQCAISMYRKQGKHNEAK